MSLSAFASAFHTAQQLAQQAAARQEGEPAAGMLVSLAGTKSSADAQLHKLLGYGSLEQPQFTISASCEAEESHIVPPHPCQAVALPPASAFDSAPLIVTGDPCCPDQVVDGSADPATHAPLSTFFPIESDSFRGRMLILAKGVPGTPAAEFKGTRLLAKSVIQGQFTQRTRAADLWVGQELLKRPLLPASFQRLVFSTAAKMFSSTYLVSTEEEGSGFLNPLLAMAATVNVSRLGQEPREAAGVTEDVRLLCPALVDRRGCPAPASQRQRYFDRPANLAAVELDPGLSYTFVLSQGIMDLAAYRMSCGPLNLDLTTLLNGQPLQMKCKNIRTNRSVVSLLVWHPHLNRPATARSGCSPPSACAPPSKDNSSWAGSSCGSSLAAMSAGGSSDLDGGSSCSGSGASRCGRSSSSSSSSSNSSSTCSCSCSCCCSSSELDTLQALAAARSELAGNDESCSDWASCCSSFSELLAEQQLAEHQQQVQEPGEGVQPHPQPAAAPAAGTPAAHQFRRLVAAWRRHKHGVKRMVARLKAAATLQHN